MSNFQVLKTETRCGYITSEEWKEIVIRMTEEGAKLQDIHNATCRGYISRRDDLSYACSYSGRYGTGVTLRTSSYKSSTYCDKMYLIYKYISKDRITSIIEQVREEHAYKIKEEQPNEKRVN